MSTIPYKRIIALIIALILLSLIPVKAAEAPKPMYVKPLTVEETIVKAAQAWGTPAEPIIQTLKCESQLNPKATNSTSREYSVGIAQINLKAHPTITEEEARDIEFAANFTAENFSKGNARIWTCARTLKFVK